MRKAIVPALVVAAVTGACLALAGCPLQSTYPGTITPIYAAAGAGGLWIFNGKTWTNQPLAGASNSVVVSGSGSGAVAYVGGSLGVSRFDGTSWTSLTGGLGAAPVNRLFIGSNVYAATLGGVSVLNSGGPTWWTNNNLGTPVNDVFVSGTFTYVAGNAGLYIYSGANLLAGMPVTPGTIVPSSGSVTAVFVDSAGDIIAGTNLGVAIQFGGTGAWNGLLSTSPVNQFAVDQNGNLYTATSNGLYINANAVAVLAGLVSCVWVDGAGTIYAGTGTGLQVSRNGGSTWTTQLPGQSVLSVTTTAPLYSF